MKQPILFLVLISLFLVGCTSDNTETEQKDNAPTALDCKRTTNDVVVRLPAAPGSLNPLLTVNGYSRQVYSLLFPPIAEMDYFSFEMVPYLLANDEGEQGVLVEEGAHKGMYAYTFNFREEAKWADGTAITPKDYIFSLKVSSLPQLPGNKFLPYLATIKDVVVTDDNPLQMTVYVDQLIIDQKEYITNTFSVLPQHIYDANNLLGNIAIADVLTQKVDEKDQAVVDFMEQFLSPDNFSNPSTIVGSGPYELESWTPGIEVKLNKKKNWWGDDLKATADVFKALPESITYKVIEEEGTAMANLKSGEVDAVPNVSIDQFLDLQKNETVSSCYNFHSTATYTYYTLYMNTRRNLFADQKTRRALAHATDVDEIISVIFTGFAERISSPILPFEDYHNPEMKPIAFDVEKSVSLLKEAGWEDTNNNGTLDKNIDGKLKELQIDYTYVAKSERSRQLGLLLQNQLKKIGVELNLNGLDNRKYFSAVKSGDFDIAIGGRARNPLSWNPSQAYHSSSADNKTGINSEELDALIEELDGTMDKAKRKELYKQVQHLIYDYQPEIFLFTPQSRLITHKRFDVKATGVDPGFSVQTFDLK